jgi:acid phosphatase (class A)
MSAGDSLMRTGMSKFLTAVLLAYALQASSCLAKDAAYVTAEQTRGDQILVSPPAPDSQTTRLELAELHRLQKLRTADQVARAKADDDEEDIFIFRDLFPGRLIESDLPALKALSDKIKKSIPCP